MTAMLLPAYRSSIVLCREREFIVTPDVSYLTSTCGLKTALVPLLEGGGGVTQFRLTAFHKAA